MNKSSTNCMKDNLMRVPDDLGNKNLSEEIFRKLVRHLIILLQCSETFFFTSDHYLKLTSKYFKANVRNIKLPMYEIKIPTEYIGFKPPISRPHLALFAQTDQYQPTQGVFLPDLFTYRNRELQRDRNKKRQKEPIPMIVKTDALLLQPRGDGAYMLSKVKKEMIVNRNALMVGM